MARYTRYARKNTSTAAVPSTSAAPVARDWSPLQRAIFNDIAEGEGHTVVLARAGTGKTTTIVSGLSYVPSGLRTLILAFNKKIADELVSRIPPGCEASTTHSFGLKSVRARFPQIKIDKYKVSDLAKARIGDGPRSSDMLDAVIKGTSLAKANLAHTAETIVEVADRHGLCDGFTTSERGEFVAHVQAMLEGSKPRNVLGTVKLDSVDFDDMIWLPVVLDLPVPKYDRVFVDETQDLNRAQLELCVRGCKTTGRICAVGDDRQAIYAFRGAAHDAIDHIVRTLEAKVLPLSITYRCPKAIVAEARTIVEDYTAHESAPEGTVGEATAEQMLDKCGPGDFILSRTNAPLIGFCLALLKDAKRANIAGRDVGAALAKLVKKSGAETITGLQEWLETWAGAEHERLSKKKGDQSGAMQVVDDKKACIEALMEGAANPNEVIVKIAALFSDEDDSSRVILSTTHKAKGLERDRVWMLRDTYRRRPGYEEDNLFYVAVTRAKKELVYVYGKPAAKQG